MRRSTRGGGGAFHRLPAPPPPGTKEIAVDVDDDGVVSLIFECSDVTPDSKFVWSKNYEDITDSSRLAVETKGNKWGRREEPGRGLSGSFVTPQLCFPQVQSCFQRSERGGRRHLLLLRHPHRRSFVQLHPLRGRLVTLMKAVITSEPFSTCLHLLVCLVQSWRGCRSSVTTTNFPVSVLFLFFFKSDCCSKLDCFFQLSQSSLQNSYSTEVRFGRGAAGEGQSSLLAAGWQDFS